GVTTTVEMRAASEIALGTVYGPPPTRIVGGGVTEICAEPMPPVVVGGVGGGVVAGVGGAAGGWAGVTGCAGGVPAGGVSGGGTGTTVGAGCPGAGGVTSTVPGTGLDPGGAATVVPPGPRCGFGAEMISPGGVSVAKPGWVPGAGGG